MPVIKKDAIRKHFETNAVDGEATSFRVLQGNRTRNPEIL